LERKKGKIEHVHTSPILPIFILFSMLTQPPSFLKKFSRNKGAVAGAVIIIIIFLVGVLGYGISPDSSTNANRMILELATKPPGYKQLVVEIKSAEEERNIFLTRIIAGDPEQATIIPITSYHIRNDSLYVQKYIDEGMNESLVIPENINGKSVTVKTITFLLGTDRFGRDILSRIILGARVSFGVGFVAVFISSIIGLFLGSIAGYYRGRIDACISWLIQVVWTLPSVLLVFAITLSLGKGLWVIYVSVGLTLWVNVARLVRGQVMAIREMNYVESARAMGLSSFRIIYRHIIPNISGPLIVVAAGNFATAILLEAGLSFLGIGVQAPQPSWGLMIKEHYNFLITQKPLLAIIPGIAIMLLVLAFNLVGNGLRDALDTGKRA
jgi:peptide/nickel transport system permease protein